VNNLSRVCLALVVLAGIAQLPAQFAFVAGLAPVVRRWSDPDAQNRLQSPDAPYDLLRAVDAALPPDATILLVTAGRDVRHAEYVTYHRALYWLTPRAVWWLAPAPPDGTWESRWWLSAPLTPESIRAAADDRHAAYVLVYGVSAPLPLGRVVLERDDGYLLQLGARDTAPAPLRVNAAGPWWPWQAALALAVMLVLGAGALAVAARLGYRADRIEAVALAWTLGAGLISLGMLWLNALGADLGAQLVVLAAVAAAAFLAARGSHKPQRHRDAEVQIKTLRLRVSVVNSVLVALIAGYAALVAISAVGRPLSVWDSWANWGMKARAIFIDGRVTPAVYGDPSRASTLLTYPLLVPLDQAWLYGWLSAPDDRLAGLVVLCCYLALLGVVYAAVRRWTGNVKQALAATAALAGMPYVMGQAGLVFPETALLLYVTVAAIYLHEWLEGGRWGALLVGAFAAGCAPWTKLEGLVLVAVLGAATVIAGRGTRRAWTALFACALAAGLVAGPWWAFVTLRGISNPAFGPLTALEPALRRLAFSAWQELVSLAGERWSFAWPLAALAGIAAWRQRRPAAHLLPLTALFYAGAIPWFYVFSTYVPYEQHVLTSIDRLVAPLAGLAVLWMARPDSKEVDAGASASHPFTPSPHHPFTGSWQVRPYRPGDEPGIAQLVQEVYGRTLDLKHYHWKLLSQPTPFPTVWLATAGERVIGHYACSPIRFKLGAREVSAGHASNAITAPDFRRQGVFTTVGHAAHAAWTAANVAFVDGIPQQFGSAWEAIGWRQLFRLIWLRRPLRLDRLVARRYGLPVPSLAALRAAGWLWNSGWDVVTRADEALSVREVAAAGGEFDELWQSAGPAYEYALVRDRPWMAYRYFAAPGQGYRVLLAERHGRPTGYAVFRLALERATGVLADLFSAPDDGATQRALLGRVIVELQRMGADQVRVLLAEHSHLERLCYRAGFVRAPGSFTVCSVSLAEPLPLDRLRDPQRWFATGGDYDVV
jgi:hypothetical protein